ncbi:MAG: type II secretion system protein [Alphaproteobacteria bacterium]|nr:type II secretion system protein [Alphaproteobacteria bacterium]
MRQNVKKKQTGSLMIEMVAVIGLIALITPILFQQIRRRNEDIIDTQIATEIRAVKDGLAAYIQANELILSKELGLYDDENENYQSITQEKQECYDFSTDDIMDFFAGNPEILDDYALVICGYTVPVSDTTYRPVIYGIAHQQDGTQPLTLRRAAKIAALIGLEGGVGTTETLKGMQGAWEWDFDGVPVNAVAAITAFEEATNSSILKDIRWQHLKAQTAQADTVTGLTAGFKNLLTVDSDDCITNYGTNSVTVKTGCTPFFEVNTSTGKVRIAGQLHIDGPIVGENHNSASCTGTNASTCEQTAGCAWTGTACVARYQLDPSYTSVMHDIKLMSLGGAKLSEVLPKWSLVDVETITDSKGLDEWTCPTGYNKGITIIPTKFVSNATTETTFSVEKSADSTFVTLSGAVKEAVVHKFCVRQNEPTSRTRTTTTE